MHLLCILLVHPPYASSLCTPALAAFSGCDDPLLQAPDSACHHDQEVLRERVLSQSEVIRAILSEDSPCYYPPSRSGPAESAGAGT